MAKPELGTKRNCPECAAKFYDLGKEPCVCPKCENKFVPEILLKSKRRPDEIAAEAARAAEAAKAAEKEKAAAAAKLTEGDDLDEADIELVSLEELEDDDDDESDDTLISMDDDDDDVTTIVDTDIAKSVD